MDKFNLGAYEVAWASWIKGLLMGILLMLLTSCGVGLRYTALNHAGHIDGIYSSNDVVINVPSNVQIDTLNYRQLQWKLRTDFQFRFDFAQYALSQPRSFDWNNRILGNRYNWNRNNWGYSYYSYWNRTQMWNDWAWGFTPHRWSPFGYDMWGYNNWMGNAHWGWNNSWWNGYNNWYNGPFHNPGYNVAWNSSRNNNVAYINGRRGSNITNYNNRTNSNIENSIAASKNKPRKNFVIEEDGVRWYSSSENDVDNSNLNSIVRDLKNKGIRVINNNNNNDQIIRNNPRTNWSTESSGNGRGSRSRENIPVKPIVPIISTPNQPRQIYRGSGSSSVQQSRGSSTSSRQNSGGTSRQRN